jgi:hypothetical protein
MPDFERLTRSLELHLARDEKAKREVRAYHRGLDHARWQIVAVVAAGVVIASLLVITIQGLPHAA